MGCCVPSSTQAVVAFQCCCVRDVRTLLKPEFHSEQLKCHLVQRMLTWILPNSGKMIYWSRATVLPATWTTSVCEYKLIRLHSERVKVRCVGRCRTGAGCRDQVQLKGWSAHLLTYISEPKPVPASWHLCCALIIYLFPSLGRRVMSTTLSCCKGKDGKLWKSPWLPVAFLCFSSGVSFPHWLWLI